MRESDLLQDKRILFVDDEQSLAMLGADILEEYGYQVLCAFDGEEALRLYEQDTESFDLVVTDESMPRLSGIELAQKIYQISPGTPVILCSGHMLSMQDEGIAETNIVSILAKTDACLKLPDLLEKIFADK